MRLLALLFGLVMMAFAQQPFITDDTEVAPLHHFHMELLTEHDVLQRTAFPNLQQNTTRFQMTYGLKENLEVGFDVPLLFILNDHRAGLPNATGFGDLDFQMKYNFHKEKDGSRLPAMAVGVFIETPTGNPSNQLGSGLADYFLNGILQKRLNDKFTLRVNSGILFSGNTLTGAIGIKSTRGVVFTGGTSVTYKASERWLVGAELVGALTNQFDLGKGQLQGLFGAKFSANKLVGLDFALTSGKFEGSPRLGGAFGVSLDF